jgi:hypothetical protein
MPEKKTIDESNAHQVYRYLLTVIDTPSRRWRFAFSGDIEQARAELEPLMPEALRDALYLRSSKPSAMLRRVVEPVGLEAWCERWLSEEDRTRMWRALRQSAYKQRHRVKRLALPQNLYLRLSIYAEDEGLTLAAALDQLLSLAANGNGR